MSDTTIVCPTCKTNLHMAISISPEREQTTKYSEVSKLKLFIEIFNALAGDDRNDVNQDIFITELLNTGKFTENEITIYIAKAKLNGQIFVRRILLAKA